MQELDFVYVGGGRNDKTLDNRVQKGEESRNHKINTNEETTIHKKELVKRILKRILGVAPG